jgi:hypothetical protein
LTTGKSALADRKGYKDRLTAGGWSIDSDPERGPDKYGYYGYNNEGKPINRYEKTQKGDYGDVTIPGFAYDFRVRRAWMRDDVTTGGWDFPVKLEFETCALCKSGIGDQTGKYYGCVKWSFTIDKNGHVSMNSPTFDAKPSPDFEETVSKWNTWASKNNKVELPQPE